MHGSALPIPFHYGHDMYDVVHETGSTQHITMPPEEDRTMAIGNMHKILVETGLVVLDICWWTYRQTDILITMLCSPTWGRVTTTIHNNNNHSNKQ